jgi:hypothetical protein
MTIPNAAGSVYLEYTSPMGYQNSVDRMIAGVSGSTTPLFLSSETMVGMYDGTSQIDSTQNRVAGVNKAASTWRANFQRAFQNGVGGFQPSSYSGNIAQGSLQIGSGPNDTVGVPRTMRNLRFWNVSLPDIEYENMTKP